MNYILFILLCLGVTYAISTEMITLPMREWIMKHSTFFGNLVFCSICTSFWVGTILGILIMSGIYWGFIVLAVCKIIEKITLK